MVKQCHLGSPLPISECLGEVSTSLLGLTLRSMDPSLSSLTYYRHLRTKQQMEIFLSLKEMHKLLRTCNSIVFLENKLSDLKNRSFDFLS